MTGRLSVLAWAVALITAAGCGGPPAPATARDSGAPAGGTPPEPPTDAGRLAQIAAKYGADRASNEVSGVSFASTCLVFHAPPPDDTQLAELAADLKAVKQPVVLDLRDCPRLGPAGLAPLVGAECVAGLYLKGPGLKTLLPTVAKGTNLRFLFLSDPTLADADLAPLAPLVKLRELALIGDLRGVTAGAYRHLAGMAELAVLKGNLAGPTIAFTDADLAHVAGLAGLKEFVIRPAAGGMLSDRGLAHLKGMTGLEDLRVEVTPGVTAESLAVIGGLKKLHRLELMDQNERPWPRAGTEKLVPLAGHLKSLKINRSRNSGTPEPPAEAAWVAAVGKLTALEVLELRQAGLTDKDVEAFAGLTRLEALDLGNNPIAGPGLSHLRPLTKLKNLELQGAALTDAAAPAVKGLPASVTTINVRNTRLTAPVLDELEKSRKWQYFFR